MPYEIEKKFLVKNNTWKTKATGILFQQGYLFAEENKVARIRIAGPQAWLTIKSKISAIKRLEFEYPIPLTDAQAMLQLCKKPIISKHRYTFPYAPPHSSSATTTPQHLYWEVDEFHAENKGLIIAEIEIPHENYTLQLPSWIGTEVSEDPRYLNANLAKHPYTKW